MSAPLPWGETQSPWTIGQVKHLGSVTLGKMLQTKDTGQDVLAPYMRAANVQPDGVLALDDVKEMWFSSGELKDLTLRQGDVVVVEGGQGGFGRAAYVDNELDGWGFQNSINRIRPYGDNDGRFLAYYLIALRATGFIRRYCNVVSMPHLTAEKLAAIPVPLPSGAEQRAIADYLDGETRQIDELIAAQQRFVGFLRERRGAVVDLLLEEAGEYGQAPLRYVAGDITVGIVIQPSQWYVEAGVPALREQPAAPAAERESTEAPAPPLPQRSRVPDAPATAPTAAAPQQRQSQAPDQRSLTQQALAAQAERLRDRGRLAAAAATTPAERRKAEMLLELADKSQAAAQKLADKPQTQVAPPQEGALMAEPFLAALRVHAAAKGAALSEDIIQGAWQAAVKATAATQRPSAQLQNPAPKGPTAKGPKKEREQRPQRHVQQEIHRQQRNAPSTPGRR
ncbi:hypothetical protein SUDANB105_05227 [Streptomyces sp. enrichment culture]|uniref:restriction endonuclease subunit S n=1 Tax=Streptomyces sp. enrichment culture TaxID=1795815 RepID=UPI003F55699E